MRFKKVDDNQPAIVKRLRDLGASVEPRLAQLGKGAPDILFAVGGNNYIAEIKDGSKAPSARKLTRDETEWHSRWRAPVLIFENEQQVEDWMNEIRKGGGL